MRRYLLSLGTLCVLIILLGAGLLLSQAAGAQPSLPSLAPAISPTPPGCTPGWTIYPNPAPPGDSSLYDMTALGPNDLWAVGSYTSTGTTHTLTVHSDGTNWTRVPSPDAGSGYVELRGVAGVGPNDVWAVGSYNNLQTLTMHWDGTAWTIVPSPNGYWYQNYLFSVTAIASNDVWAVGQTTSGSFHSWTLIEHWDGTAWTIVPSPNPSMAGPRLYGVTAVNTNDIWAVGGGIPGINASFIEHWDGSAWSIVPSPSTNGTLNSVAAVSANDVWAVGYDNPGSGPERTLIQHWDGSSWSLVPSFSPGATVNNLYGVRARAANDVWAVGDTDQENGGGVKTLVEHWDGSTWTQVPTPDNPTGRDHFYAVVARSGGPVWAVGEYGCTGGCLQNALIARYGPLCGSPTPTPTPCSLAWRTVPSPSGGNYNDLYGVAVVSPNDAWAVGVYTPNSYAQTLTEHWDGTSWSIVPSPAPNVSYLYGVTAVSTNDVWAVGFLVYDTLIEHWNGSSWSIVPNPSPGNDSYLYGVAAVSANDVWAVGVNGTTGGTLIEHWNGTNWSIVSSPNPGSSNYLSGIAVVAVNDIWAVGRYSAGGPLQTLTEHWDGTNWSIVPSPSTGPGYNTLNGVAAVAANDVWAVGYYQANGGSYAALIEHWNGTNWSIVPSPSPSPGAAQLYGVAAVAANDIWAVGYFQDTSSPYRTLVEHWNGSSWSVVPSPNGYLRGVAAVAANDLWAVGDRLNGTLVEHYSSPCGTATVTATRTPMVAITSTRTAIATPTCSTGPAWSVRPETYPAPAYLYGVAAVSTNDAWAVGYYRAQHWNGSTWSAVPLPTPGSGYNSLYGVATVSGNDVWAVGTFYNNGGQYQTLTEHWNGASWSVVPSPNQGTSGSELHAVTAISANDVWAVGWYGCCDPTNTLIEHWDGNSWSIVSSPSPGVHESHLYGAAAISANDVWAVGWYRNTNNTPEYTLTEHWNGSSWSVVPSLDPNPNGNFLYAVAGISSNDVWAVGLGLTEHWDGAAWNVVPNPGGNMQAVAAVSSNDVWAVGYGAPGPPVDHPTSSHWNGSTWSAVSVPDPGGLYNELHGVAAVSSSDVWAVGWSNYSPRPGDSLIEHYAAVSCGTATATPTTGVGNTPTRTHTPVPPSNTPTRTHTPVPPSNTAPVQHTATAVSTPGGPTSTPSMPTATSTVCTITFSDVPDTNLFYAFIRCLACRGIINGYADGTFRPNNLVTRGQMSKFVSNAANYQDPIPPTQQTFSDVPPGSTFWLYVERAYLHGIISGYNTSPPCATGIPCFLPANSVTRGQTAKFVSQAANYQDPIPPAQQTFTDVPSTNTFWLYIERVQMHGVVSGYNTNPPCTTGIPCFLAGNHVTRGQTSKFIANAFFPDCDTPQ